MATSIGTGIGNRLSAQDELSNRASVIDNFVQRTQKLGKFPGTHSLGKEFETPIVGFVMVSPQKS